MSLKKDIVPLLISLVLVLLSIAFNILVYYELNYKQYIGITLVVLSTLLYFKGKKIYPYVFGITLLAGAVDLIDFFFIGIVVRLGPVDFNLVMLFLLVLFLFLNKPFIHKLFPDKKPINKADQITEQEKTEIQIQHFEQKFQNKTEAELKAILDKDNPYVNESRIAAQRVLKDKYGPSK